MQKYTKSLVLTAGCCGLFALSILSVIKTFTLVGLNGVHMRPALSSSANLTQSKCSPYVNELNSTETLLVLVTSPSAHHERSNFTRNVILNWSMLRPWIQPVIFVDNITSPIAAISEQNGWLVRPVPRARSNLPIFKDMILEASAISPRSPFVGFANDDILFGYDIINTMAVINERLRPVREKFVFISGRRRNVDGELIARIASVHCPRIVYLLAKDVEPFTPDSADYFIFASSTVSQYWADMPDFVIGRAGYDNWLISSAVTRQATAIESTLTITALHQTGQDGIRSGQFKPGSRNQTDRRLNRELIPDFDYSAGFQYCTRWITESICKERRYPFKILKKECIRLSERPLIKQSCFKHVQSNDKKITVNITTSNLTGTTVNNVADDFNEDDYDNGHEWQGGHQHQQ